MALPQHLDTVVIGGGQAGLSVGYHLARRGVRFAILDASPRIGDAWRGRWDSLRLFSPAEFDGLPGMPFPAPAGTFPTKDEMADYLEAYAARFELPVRTGTRVERLSRRGSRFVVEAGGRLVEADQVVVAMSSYQRPRVPEFAKELGADVAQLHSSAYRNVAQLREGPVLVAGAGNSGAEIALEAARAGHRTWVAGRDVGEIPFDVTGRAARLFLRRLLFRVVFHRVLTLDTPFGRSARRRAGHRGVPLIRTKSAHLAAGGVERVPRVIGARDGLPVLEGGATLRVSNLVWCTGFTAGLSWIDLPVFGDDGEPRHVRGVASDVPGLYFVGLHFLHALSSAMIHGVGRDAEHVAGVVAARASPGRSAPRPAALGAAVGT